MPTVYLSPSTQEYNPYITGAGSEEYFMNLIADAMEPYLLANGIQSSRNPPDMPAASSIRQANQGSYDFYLAIHSNASGSGSEGQTRGIIAFYYPTSANGRRAAELFAQNLREIYPLPQLVTTRATTSLGEVRQPRFPSVLLEIGYHDNYEDAQWIENNIDPIAQSLVQSLTAYFGLPFVYPGPARPGTAQTAYELQTSSNMGGQYTTLSTAETDASSFATPAGQFAQGTLMWRVRTKNGDGVWGSYSAAATIIIRRAPVVPVIVYTDTKPRPTIRWQSADQQGVRIQIGDYDTGWMHSTAKEFRMPYFLQDGTYPVQLAIKTVFGVESAPAVGSITVLNVPGPTIEAAFNARLNAIEISWETDAAYAEYFILRDGVPIARSAGSGITDRLCAGKHVYTVRGVTPEGYYGDSAPVHAFLAIENAVIGSVEDGAPWLKLRLRAGERPAHDGSYSAQVDYVHYYGRTKPEPYTCGMQDASHDFAFTLRDAAQMDVLRGLLGSAVVYKDCWGDVVVGMLGNIQAAHGRARDVQFTVVETDHRQEISYE